MTAQWQNWLLVMAGGALGAAGRFWLGEALLRSLGDRLPWGTLAANLAGSLAVGFLAEWLQGRGPVALYWRAFLVIGVLGALTTYSSLMLESLLFARAQRAGLAVSYLAITLAGGLVLVWCGARLAAMLRG